MTREQLAEKILDMKREKNWSWKYITDEIGGMSPLLVVGALLGQMKLPKPIAEKAAALFGLSDSEHRMLNEVPMRGMPMPPPMTFIVLLMPSFAVFAGRRDLAGVVSSGCKAGLQLVAR